MEHTYVREGEKINPFFSIWLSTRKTTRYILDNKNLRYSLILAVISGIPLALSSGSQLLDLYDIPLRTLLIGLFLLGPLYGLLSWGVSTLLFTYIGKWLGGVGTLTGMGKAMGIVMIPAIWMTPFWILETAIAFNQPSTMQGVTNFSTSMRWIFISGLITFVYSIFMILIQSRAIGEVHEFSSWKGFGTIIIPAVILGILSMFILMSIMR